MSRSRKSNPVVSNCTMNHGSLKKDKRRANKGLRKSAKNLLKDIQDGILDVEDYVDPTTNEVTERWTWADDGKTRVDEESDYYEKALRK